MVVLDKFQIHTFLAVIVIVLLLLLFLCILALSSVSEPSAFGISTESSASGSIISATSAPNSSDSGQLSVSISYVRNNGH